MPGASSGPGPGLVELHRSRFVEWQPSGVAALAASGDGSLVAAAREAGDIELYETATAHCFLRLPGHRDACLTCVALVDEEEGSKGGLTSRLFTGGLDGALVEWDVEQRRAGPVADSLGGAVWQLVPEPGACIKSDAGARVAAACDDGCARIFQAEAGVPGLSYVRTLPRVEGRTLAVAWHPSGEVLATAGTDGCIHLWAVSSGQEVLRITARDGSGRSIEACIWALLVLQDGTVVSGDSSGNVQFWDGRFGTLLARFSQHQADVLQLAASPDGNMVFASGVDPQVALFHRLPEGGSEGSGSGKQLPWAYLSSKRPHTHDVRAMCVAAGKHLAEGGARLFSGSNDTQLFMHSVEHFLKEHPVSVNPSPQLPLLQATQAAYQGGGLAGGGSSSSSSQREQQPPWLLCAQRSDIDVWQLAEARAQGQMGPPTEGALLPPASAPQHLLRLVAQSGRHVSAACMSQDRRWLAYSDCRRVSCFSLEPRPASEAVPAAHVVPSPLQLPSDLPAACHLAFRADSTELVACAADGTLRVIDVASCPPQQQADGGPANGGPVPFRVLHDLQYKSSFRRDRQRSAARRLMPLVELMALSPDGSWLAAVVRQRVHLVSLTSHKLAHSLPPMAEPQPPITAMTFTADSSAVVVAASTHQIAAYSVASGQPTEWMQQQAGSLPPKLLHMPGVIASIASCPAAPASLFLASSQACCHLDIAQPVDAQGGGQDGGAGRKRRRAHKPVLTTDSPGVNCRMIYCSDPVLHAAYLGPEALLVVERPWEEVHKGVAAPMYRHRYGT